MKKIILLITLILSQSVYAELPEISFLHLRKDYKEKEIAVVSAVLSAPASVEVSVVIVPSYVIGEADEMDHEMGAFAKIIIAPGQIQGSISFYLPDEGIHEGLEALYLKMTAPQNARLGNSNMAIFIRDESVFDLPVVNFSSSSYLVLEGGSIELKATLSGPATSIVIVPISVSGSATHYVDHNMHYTDEFIFYPGMTEATLNVTTFVDNLVEPLEDIIIRMFAPIVNARMGEIRETTISIEDSSI